MINSPTVLVIGAGASVEFGLPSGAELLKQIAKLIDYRFEFSRPKRGDVELFNALRILLGSDDGAEQINLHLEAARDIIAASSQAPSIDYLIDAQENEKVRQVAKVAIVRAITVAEARSVNFRLPDGRGDLDLSKFENTWYQQLAQLLFVNARRSAIEDAFENLLVVNFNYDRCLEQFLPASISSWFGIPLAEAQKIANTLRVVRPYGVAGSLPWQESDAPRIQFGGGNSKQ